MNGTNKSLSAHIRITASQNQPVNSNISNCTRILEISLPINSIILNSIVVCYPFSHNNMDIPS